MGSDDSDKSNKDLLRIAENAVREMRTTTKLLRLAVQKGETLQDDLDQAGSDYEQLQEVLLDYQNKFNKFKKKGGRMVQKDNAVVKKQADMLRESVDNIVQNNEELTFQNKAYKISIGEFKKKLTEASRKIRYRDKTLNDLRTVVSDLEDAVRTYETDLAKEKFKINQLRGNHRKIVGRYASLSRVNKYAQVEKEKIIKFNDKRNLLRQLAKPYEKLVDSVQCKVTSKPRKGSAGVVYGVESDAVVRELYFSGSNPGLRVGDQVIATVYCSKQVLLPPPLSKIFNQEPKVIYIPRDLQEREEVKELERVFPRNEVLAKKLEKLLD